MEGHIPHLNINGYTGVGKTTISLLLATAYRTLWIPRVTTRPMRRGENVNEYLFVSNAEFMRQAHSLDVGTDVILSDREDEGPVFSHERDALVVGDAAPEILRLSVHQVRWRKDFNYYLTGVPAPHTWPKPRTDTELVLSTFGYISPIIKEQMAPEMLTIFIDVSDKEVLRERLRKRCRAKSQHFGELWKKNLAQFEKHRELEHDFVVYNNGDQEKCAAEIAKIAGLPRRI